jgi:hypothetical protein
VILSAALFGNYLTLLVVATYVLAPLPNWIAGRCANPDDFIESNSSAWIDLGRFATGFLVVMGIGESCGHGTERSRQLTETSTSSPSVARPHCADSNPRHDHVHRWRVINIRHDNQFQPIFQRGTGLLSDSSRLGGDYAGHRYS